MNRTKNAVVLLYDTFTFGGLENYMLSVSQMCQEEDLPCWMVSLQKCDNPDVISLSNGEFLNVRFPSYAYSFAKLLKTLRPTIVHSQSYYSLILSSSLRSVFGYQTVCTIHNPFSVTEKSGPFRNLLPSFLSPDVLMGVSRQSLDQTLSCFRIRAKKKLVIYNWVDTQRFTPFWEKKPNQILFVGRLDQQKRIEMLPRLVRLLRNELPDVVLHVCGTGPLADMVKGIDHIAFHGKVDDSTLLRLLQESAVLVLPTRFEGLPLVILESLSCGTPVVASPVGGIPEIAEISHGCHLANNEEDFANSVKSILKEGTDYRRIHKEAVENFSYKRGKKDLIGVYEELSLG